MIRPPPWASMVRPASWARRKTASRLILKICCHRSGGKSSAGQRYWIPAPLTRMSTRPPKAARALS